MKKARDVLSTPSGGKAMPLRAWFADPKNRRGREFLETWLEMRSRGESDWSGQRVLRHLRSEFGLPGRSEANFYLFLRGQYPRLADRAIVPR